MSANNGFRKCDADTAMKLYRQGEVKAIFWLNNSGDMGYPERCVRMSGGIPSDYAVVAGPHPFSEAMPVNTPRTNN